MVNERPHPITLADELVAAVHDRLVEQNDLLRQLLDRLPPAAVGEEPAPFPAGPVLVTEPAPPPTPGRAGSGSARKPKPRTVRKGQPDGGDA